MLVVALLRTHNNKKNDQLKMKRMFKVEETSHSTWDGRFPIDLKNDNGEGKTIGLVAKTRKKEEQPKISTR